MWKDRTLQSFLTPDGKPKPEILPPRLFRSPDRPERLLSPEKLRPPGRVIRWAFLALVMVCGAAEAAGIWLQK